MKIKKIYAENFTVFDNIDIDFVSGINIFMGKNGTGKTQLLKAIYGMCEVAKYNNIDEFSKCFKIDLERGLNRDNTKKMILKLYDNKESSLKEFSNNYLTTATQKNIYTLYCPNEKVNATYIPAKDMLTHSKGLIPMSTKYSEFPFEKTNLDIITRAMQWSLKNKPLYAEKILGDLERKIDGQVIVENDEFFILKNDGRKISFFYEAEGMKKMGLFWRLLMNENITPNSILIWDEPEANINPEHIIDLVKHIIELSRVGVQVFVSTHNYMLAKCFSVYSNSDDCIMFHSLYNDKETDIVKINSDNNFESIQPNSILSAMDRLVEDVYGISLE